MATRLGTYAAFFAVLLFAASSVLAQANPTSIVIQPTEGVFSVGTTFDVSVLLNTGGESVNAIDLYLEFPADKLQVVSPSAGPSLIQIWTTQPTYDNRAGTLHFQGGIPGGIVTQGGILSTISFRVRSTGQAFVRVGNASRVLLNDGRGTDVLERTTPSILTLVLPPPAGPIVNSPTHPDQTRWYSADSVVLRWTTDEAVEGYSYELNGTPIFLPDDIIEGTREEVIYQNLTSGIHYFHIKALRNGLWGGLTHFAINIDRDAPASFPLEVVQGVGAGPNNVAISFGATDRNSGVDHYEIRVTGLSAEGDEVEDGQTFFIETSSPYITNLPFGQYTVIVRAYDQAGNVSESQALLEVSKFPIGIVPGGIRFGTFAVIPWYALLLLVALSSMYGARILWASHPVPSYAYQPAYQPVPPPPSSPEPPQLLYHETAPPVAETPTRAPVSSEGVAFYPKEQVPKVISVSLINADLDQPISQFDPLRPGTTIDLTTLPTRNLNIRANTEPETVGSVRWSYGRNLNFRTDSVAPYAFAGDSTDGDYFPWTPAIGPHLVTATPYTEPNATGEQGITYFIEFAVTDSGK